MEKVIALWKQPVQSPFATTIMQNFHNIVDGQRVLTQEVISKLLHWGRTIAATTSITSNDILPNFKAYNSCLTPSDSEVFFWNLCIYNLVSFKQ